MYVPLKMADNLPSHQASVKYRVNPDFVEAVNNAQNSWVATVYPEYEKLTLQEHLARAGGRV